MEAIETLRTQIRVAQLIKEWDDRRKILNMMRNFNGEQISAMRGYTENLRKAWAE
jgi:hypothetical protein